MECVVSKKHGDWHPHVHCLIEIPPKHKNEWLDQLKAEWLRITGDSHVLRLDPIYGKSKSGKKLYRRVNMRALRELVKYVTKAADFADQPDRVVEFFEAFRSVRRVQAFGSFVGALKEAEREPGDEQGLLPCSCGACHLHSEFNWQRELVHISQTIELPDGSRQLAFDYAKELRESVPDESPPWYLTPFEPRHVGQHEMGFAGAMPDDVVEQPNLFEGVA